MEGELHNQNALEFLDQSFDVLVGWYEKTHPFLDPMISQSKAKFKVGFAGSDQRLFDLILNISPRDVDLFESELKKYLTLMKKFN